MKMQDKELDELFRSNLDDFEIKPSSDVWAGIDAELEKGRRKKAYVSLLSIAASIIILFTVGVLFIPQKISIRTQTDLVKIMTPTRKNVSSKAVAKNSDPNKTTNTITKIYAGNYHKPKHNDLTQNDEPVTAKSDEQPQLSNADKADVITSQQPEKNIQFANIQPVQIKTPLTIEPTQITDKSPTIKPKHAPLSLGGMINAMVAKVDKRQDKIIEFTDDDGESSITGVNLGIIKIKKDQQTTEK